MHTDVLLIEDEQLITLFVQEALAPMGLKVLSLCDHAGAFELVYLGGIACAIIDVGLPGIPGDELARTLRARWPMLPIVLMTGYEPDAFECAFQGDFLVRVLPKPFDEGRLLSVLESLIDIPRPRPGRTSHAYAAASDQS